MNDIQNSFFETIKQFSEHSKETSNATIVIEATILDVVNEGLGEYLIKYLGNNFSVFAQSSVSYSVGDNVYVLVPEGDFSKSKVIIGLVNPNERKVFSDNNKVNKYYEISDNFITENLGTIEMSSYDTTKVEDISVISNYNVFAEIVNDLIKDGKNIFKFVVSACTNLEPEQRSGGNYGITLKIPLITKSSAGGGLNQTIWKSYTLDISNMLGDPYRFEAWSPQDLYITIDNQYKIDATQSPTISYFCYDFSQDANKVDIKDIYLKDIGFYAVSEIAEGADESGLNLVIKSTEGLYFAPNYSSTKTLTANLKVNGKTANLNTAKIYWFVEDISVKTDNKYYCTYGGLGWRCLNQKTNVTMSSDGIETFDWVTNSSKININKDDIIISARIKCVVLYNDNKVSKIITLKNLGVDNYFTLSTSVENNTYIKNTGYAHVIAKLQNGLVADPFTNVTYYWQRYDKNGNYIQDESSFFEKIKVNEFIDNEYITEIKFPINKIEDFNYISCTAKFQDKIIGTQQIIIYTSENNNSFNLIINNDNILYKYDTDGNSPTRANYNGPLSSAIKEIVPITYTIKKPNGEELTSEEYSYVKYKLTVSKDSLFKINNYTSEDEDNYYLEGYDNTEHSVAFPYTLVSRYNQKNNNKIILSVTFNDIVLEKNIIINFTKEGQNGTNGTSYAALIVSGGNSAETSYPYGTLDSYGVAKKQKLLYNILEEKLFKCDMETDSLIEWNPQLDKFYIQVYKDGELLNENNYTVEWSILDKRSATTCFSCVGDIHQKSISIAMDDGIFVSIPSTYCNIIQAKVIVRSGNAITNDPTIFAYYPIELILAQGSTETLKFIPCLEGGFSEVMYAADGTNPSWDESEPLRIDNILHIKEKSTEEIFQNFTCLWNSGHHLRETFSSTGGKKKKYVPNNKYDDGSSDNFLYAYLYVNEDQANNIEHLIDTYEESKTEESNQILHYQNCLQQLTNFGNMYYFIKWDYLINSASPLLNALTQGKNSLDVLEKYLNDFYEYLDIQKLNNINFDILCPDLILKLKTLADKRNELFNYIINLNNYSDLFSLLEYQIPWSPQKRQEYIELLGLNTTLQLELYIQNVNSEILKYEEYYNLILSYSNTPYLSNYNVFKADFLSALQNFDLPEFEQIKAQLLSYYNDKICKTVSVRENLQILNDVYDNVLQKFYNYGNNSLDINSITLNYYNNKIDLCNKNITELNNNIQEGQALLSLKYRVVQIIRPVVFYFNRYGMCNLNAWDGSKIYTGENNEFLLAPQVGAGIKEEDNSFTGIVIGQRNIYENQGGGLLSGQTGLFGYSKGKQSIFMNAKTGASIFGVAGTGGQIIVDPSSSSKKALLYSSNYFKNYNNTTGLPTSYGNDNLNGQGMIIDLSTPEIRFGSGNFIVDSNGHVTAKGGGAIAGWVIGETVLTGGATTLNSNGTITCADLQANTAGKIGGWTISSNSLSANGIAINSNGSIKATNNRWSINSDGTATFYNVNITADSAVTSKAGNILIKQNSIESANFGAGGGFQINADGSATFRNVTVSGYATSGEMSAAVGRIGTIESTYVKTATLEANYLTAATVKAQYMEVANWVSAGYIKADKIDANTFSGKTIVAESLNATGTFLTLHGYLASWKDETIVTGVSVDFSAKKVNVTTKNITYLGTTR